METHEQAPSIPKIVMALILTGVLLVTSVIVGRFSVSSSLAVDNVESAAEAEESDVKPPALSCRYGASAPGATAPWLETFGMGQFLNFGLNGSDQAGAEYLRMVRLKEAQDTNGNYLGTYILGTHKKPIQLSTILDNVSLNPGKIWIIGNEVDRVQYQDDMHANVYALAYHDLYYAIKAVDPTAQIAFSALVQVTPSRLQYLDMVWASYIEQFGSAMPVDVWTAHIYPLAELNVDGSIADDGASLAIGTDPALGMYKFRGDKSECLDHTDNVLCMSEHDDMTVFANQLYAMRLWMKEHGQQNKPLIVTEFGELYPYFFNNNNQCTPWDEFHNCFAPARVNDFITKTFNYFEGAKDTNVGYPADEYRLAQQWMWYSINSHSGVGHSSNLVVSDYLDYTVGDENAITEVGQHYRTEVLKRPLISNLWIQQALSSNGSFVGGTGSVDIDISVIFRNTGNTPIFDPVKVTFFKNAALTQEIGSVVIDHNVVGCARAENVATVTWEGMMTPGAHDYWVKVDSSNQISESSEGDNVAKGTVFVEPRTQFLSIVQFDH